MKRTKFPDDNGNAEGQVSVEGDMKTYSELVSRALLAARLGQHFGGERNIYNVLGYQTSVDYEDCVTQYLRQDIAAAIINRPVDATWRGDFKIIESDDDKETALEKEWEELSEKLSLQSIFARLDRLSGIGRYGILLLGFNDVSVNSGFAEPIKAGQHELIYVKPLDEGSAEIKEWEKNTADPRYGLPTMYDVGITQPGTKESTQIKVHYTRLIHVPAGTLLESEVYGEPRLRVVFNRLKDLEKLVGASAEMFWLGARPGYQGIVDAEGFMTPETEADLQDQIDEYEHKLRRTLINQGIEWKAMETQLADPEHHVDVQIQMISAVTGIPKRILTGSERGELASTEDKSNWKEAVEARQHEYAEPMIVRSFVDRMTDIGILPPPKESYSVQWPDLWAMSEKEKVDIGKVRATALKDYGAAGPATEVLPPDAFLEFGLGLEEDNIERINEMREAAVLEEEKEMAEMEEAARLEEEARLAAGGPPEGEGEEGE